MRYFENRRINQQKQYCGTVGTWHSSSVVFKLPKTSGFSFDDDEEEYYCILLQYFQQFQFSFIFLNGNIKTNAGGFSLFLLAAHSLHHGEHVGGLFLLVWLLLRTYAPGRSARRPRKAAGAPQGERVGRKENIKRISLYSVYSLLCLYYYQWGLAAGGIAGDPAPRGGPRE